jgi:C_GCAxxG_C_C family probable redox protein
MRNLEETKNRAGELYGSNFHCCEAILMAVCEKLDYENDLLLKIASPFGGGLTANGSACGSLVAAYLCMGIFKGRSSAKESRDAANSAADRIYKKFCEKYG